MKEVITQYTGLWKKLGPNQKATIFAVTVVCILAFGGILFYAQKPSFAHLMGELSEEDQSAIVRYLDDNNIQYQVEGGTIRVEREQVNSIRAQIVEKQLVKGGEEGYSLLDKTNLGITDKIQDLNIVRAIEGEIAKTLKLMSFVKAAKVKISQGDKSLYARSETPPKASVLLTLKPGSTPTPGQVNSIVNYVAGAFSGLKPNQIVVTDQNGKLLHAPREATEEASNAILASDRLAYQLSMESALTGKAQSMLDNAYGAGKTLVRVNVAVKDPPPTKEERKVDPKDRIKSSKKTERESTNKSGTVSSGGTAGSKDSLDAVPKEGKGPEGTETLTETNMEYYPGSETIVREARVGFGIAKLSVALMIDKSLTMTKPAKEGDVAAENPSVKPSIEQQVALAVGFDATRGDEKVVASVVEGMFKEEAPVEEPEGLFGTQTILELSRYGAEAIVAIFLLLFLKGMIKKAGKGQGSGTPGMPDGTGLPPEVLARIQARRSTEALIASDGEGSSRVAKKWMAGAKK